MNKAWQQIDLNGRGLQSVNLALSREMRKHRVAYGWWLLFPIGGHRLYLAERVGACLYTALTLLAVLLFLTFGAFVALIAVSAVLLWALFDLWWIDRRITAYNKRLRMRMFLQQDSPPPAGYRGRAAELDPEHLVADYAREKEQERGGHQPVTGSPADSSGPIPTFQEQEALLRELARRRRRP